MRTKLIKFYHDLHASYWFIPLLMVLAAISLHFATNYYDRTMGFDWLDSFRLLHVNQPDGARVILSTIAGSMITVAGVTFSMTIVSVSFVSSQFGPRLIGNFMRDKGNQVTLGTFIATFVYCLLTLLSVRNAEEGPADAENLIVTFVPHFSILFSLLLALASVVVLIYFIHHIPETINISNITGKIGNQLRCDIQAMFPDELGSGREVSRANVVDYSFTETFRSGAEIRALGHGFIETLDDVRLMKLAEENDLLIRLQYRPGDFATESDVVMLAVPSERVNDDMREQLSSCMALGQERTSTQNILFLSDQLVEMIARALSPGVNDPYTAINCMNWLKCALVELGRRQVPDHRRYDDNGNLRIVAFPITFTQFADNIFDGARQYVSGDRNAALHMLKIIADVGADLSDEYRSCLLKQAELLSEACQTALDSEDAQSEIAHRVDQIKSVFQNREKRYLLRDDQGWLGGRG